MLFHEVLAEYISPGTVVAIHYWQTLRVRHGLDPKPSGAKAGATFFANILASRVSAGGERFAFQ
jgi:hypothetical protein